MLLSDSSKSLRVSTQLNAFVENFNYGFLPSKMLDAGIAMNGKTKKPTGNEDVRGLADYTVEI